MVPDSHRNRVVLRYMTATKQRATESMLQKIFVAVFGLILFLLPYHAFISTWGGTAIGPLLVWKSWKEIVLLAVVPLVIWYCALRPDITRALLRSWLNRFIIAYIVLQLIFAVLSHASSEAVIAGLLMNLRFLAMFVLAQIILAGDHSWAPRLKKAIPTWLLITTIILAVLAILQVTVLPREFLANFGYNKDITIAPFLVVDQDPNALRAFATMRGPNPLGSYLLLPLMLAIVVIARERRSLLVGFALGLGTVALVLTSARSAWLGAAAGAAVAALAILPREKLLKWIKIGAIPAIIAVFLFSWLAVTVPAIRIAVFHSRPDRSTLTEGSSDKHWQETRFGMQDAIAHPLGQGVGTAGPASFYNKNQPPKIAENYFVQVAQETGLIGLGLFVAINVLVAFQLWRNRHSFMCKALLASFIGITVVNFFLHGWADDPTAMTWWGVAGLYLARVHNKKAKS